MTNSVGKSTLRGTLLTVEQKRNMTPQEIIKWCPHDPALSNPCPCGVQWGMDIDGDWYIGNRWAS